MGNNNQPRLSFVFNRTGNMISDKGTVTSVGIANGVAVYTPNSIRKFQMDLDNQHGVDYSKGTLRVIYSASSDVKPARLAEAELAIQR